MFVVRSRIVRDDPQHLPVAADRLVEKADRPVGLREVVVRGGMPGSSSTALL